MRQSRDILILKNKKKEVLTTLYEKIIQERQRLQSQLISLQESLDKCPDGKLVCCHNNTRTKWYQSDGHHKTYIPKANRPLAERLAYKKYLTTQQDDLIKEINALDTYLKLHPDLEKSLQQLNEDPEFSALLSSSFTPHSKALDDWSKAPYDSNPHFPEHLIHKTTSGLYVRSKSESMIAHILYINKIPFRYECALTLGNITLYPDFTIRHPITGEYFYWEHFGLMDDPSYSKNAVAKLQTYIQNGIIPSIQLLTTFETSGTPLTMDVISKTVEHYFVTRGLES